MGPADSSSVNMAGQKAKRQIAQKEIPQKIRVALVGATGVAGQEFLRALESHPWFDLVCLAASPNSAGKRYEDAIRGESGQISWYGESTLPKKYASMVVKNADEIDALQYDLIFSAMDAGPAKALEARYAQDTPVISTSSAFRYEDDVPLLLPGINEEQIGLLKKQGEGRGWKGFISPNPNCTTVGLAISLAPLHAAFGVESVHLVSMQAVSGAGRTPGVSAMDVVDNIIPYIPKEEEKVALETRKALGRWSGQEAKIELAPFGVSATCTRVAVLEGHTGVVHVKLSKTASAEEIAQAWRDQGQAFLAKGYPSAPKQLIEVSSDPFRPQVRLDRDSGGGMTTVVGRLREDVTTQNAWKYMFVSHNTKMGAAKGCVLMAEELVAKGLIKAKG